MGRLNNINKLLRLKTNKFITFLLTFFVMLAVCMTLFSLKHGNIKLIIRIIM